MPPTQPAPAPLPLRLLRVVANHHATLRMRRVTLGGSDLGGFTSVGPDQQVAGGQKASWQPPRGAEPNTCPTMRLVNPRHRSRILPACFLVALVAFGWYATQSVRPADCEVSFSAFTGSDGQPLPENGEEVTWDELDERAYQDLVASGRYGPPTARWHRWLG
ncbi:hypothetical protein [Streptomyces zaomyceticus]|uniref:hypothetical protein n=1 Tax=Streptomyces zaomyceticus TaxID=68286 RepID=UPI0032561044